MPRYTFNGAEPRILLGLSQGVNARHYPEDGETSALVDGQTIIIQPGDSVATLEPYVQSELAEVPDPAAPAAPVAPVPDPAVVAPAPDAPVTTDPSTITPEGTAN